MSEIDVRLLRCFASVFPALSEEELRAVTNDSDGHWDSLSTVTLAALVQEEFDFEIEPGMMQQLNSFEAFRTYLQQARPDRSGR